MAKSAESYSRWRDPVFWLIFIGAILLRAIRLHFPGEAAFDEIYYIPAAEDYLQLRPDNNSVHPPLAKIQMAAVILLADTAQMHGLIHFDPMVAGRLTALLTGIGTLYLTHRLALTISGRPLLANLTMLLVGVDALSIVQSRIAMMDQIQTFWILAGFVYTAEVLFAKKGFDQVVFAGLCFGVATACKWSGFFAAFGAWLALMGAVRPFRPGEKRGLLSPDQLSEESLEDEGSPPETIYPRRSPWHKLACTLIFLICGVAVYAASYIPFLLTEEKVNRESFNQIVGFHKRMINFRYDPDQFKHRYLSHWYEWPFVTRPVWYYYVETGDNVQGIVGIGNPLFWWPAFFLILESVWLGFLRVFWRIKAPPQDLEEPEVKRLPSRYLSDPVAQLICCFYFPQWFFWALGTTGGFIYYMLPMIPIMALAMARHLEELWMEKPGRYMAYGYLVVLLLITAAYYPLLTGIEVPTWYFHKLFFIDKWI